MTIEKCIKDLQLEKGFKFEMAAKYFYNNFLYLLNKSDSKLSREEICSAYLETIRVVIEHLINPRKEIKSLNRYFYKIFLNIRNSEKKNKIRRGILLVEYQCYACSQQDNDNLELNTIIEIINKLNELTEREKNVISLYFCVKKNHQQIANELNISVSNSKTILSRAKAKIRNSFKTRKMFVKELI